jgi:O-acetyl-ADP-ribose deacetylase (regulator of RNase III)
MKKFKETIAIAESDNLEDLKLINWLPRGSALITSSGDLNDIGIKAIVHAATGSMNQDDENPEYYEPTLESIKDSINNGFYLVKKNGFSKLAVPFIGGKIFLARIGTTPQILAETIIKTCFENEFNLDFTLVTFPSTSKPTDNDIFSSIIKKKYPKVKIDDYLKDGDICDYSLHKCDVIMNAANMEVEFGGGLSKSIAIATNDKDNIDKEAANYISDYYK